MPEYRVAFSEGSSVANDAGGRQFRGIQRVGFFEAESRVDVFLQMYRDYSEVGKDVTVFTHDGKNLLDFTHEELSEIYDREKITLNMHFPVNGAQIQSIKPASEFQGF